MASINEIKSILRKALGTRATEKELDILASTISAKSQTSAKAGENSDLLEGQIALNKELGRTKEALEALLALRSEEAAQQAEIAAQLDDYGNLDKEQIEILKQREDALKDVQKELDSLNRQKEESAEMDRALGSLAQNVALSYYNMADAGVTTSAVFGKIKGAATNVSKSLKEISKSNNKLAASMSAAGGAMKSAFNSEAAQGIRKQGDALNQVFMQAQRWSDISKTLQSQNQMIYQQTGLLTKDNTELAMSLAEVADKTKSLQVADESLISAKVELQNQFAFFNQQSKATQNEVLKVTALLEKAGVSATTTAENYEFFTKALGFTSEEAVKNSLKLRDVALNMGQSPEKIARAFSQGRKYIARFGRDYMGTFTKMIGVSGKLGIEIDTLLNSLDSMDTISGAAEASATLNAILRVDTLKAGDVMRGDYESKLRQLSAAFKQTSVDLTAEENRGALKQTAAQMEMDESEVLKLYRAAKKGSIEKTIKDMTKVTDKSTTTASKLDEQNRKAMTSDQVAKKNLEQGQLKLVDGMTKLQNVMSENVMLIKGLAAAFSAATTIGSAVSGGKSAIDKFRQARRSGKSIKSALASATVSGVSSAANQAGALRVFVVNADEFPSGGGGDFFDDESGFDLDPDGDGDVRSCRGKKGRAKKRCKKKQKAEKKRNKRRKKNRKKRRQKNKSRRIKNKRRKKRNRVKRKRRRGKAGLLTSLIPGSVASVGMPDMGEGVGLAIEATDLAVDASRATSTGTSVSKSIAKESSKKAAETAVKQGASKAPGLMAKGGAMGGKALSKILPGVGSALFAYDAKVRAEAGDTLGATLASAGAVSSLIPGVGTAVALGIEAVNLGRDALNSYVPEIGEAVDTVLGYTGIGLIAKGVDYLMGNKKKKKKKKRKVSGVGVNPSKDPRYAQQRREWSKMSNDKKTEYCDEHGGRPPYGVDPFACSELYRARHKEFAEVSALGEDSARIRYLAKGMGKSQFEVDNAVYEAELRRRARTKGQVNDFRGISGSKFKRNINANTADQLIGVKEGGLIDTKLDKLISAMSRLADRKRVTLNVDKKELAKINVSAMNDNIYGGA